MKKSLKRVATKNAKKRNTMSDEDFYIKFENDSVFSGMEYVNAVKSNGFAELYGKLKSGARKLYKKNTGARLNEPFESLIAMDVIVEAVGDRVINGYATPSKSIIWRVYYKEQYKYNQTNDKDDFKNWFNFSLNEAQKRKCFIY